VGDPLWIVEIPLCEGGEVERWLELWHISLWLLLAIFLYLSALSLYLTLLLLLIFIHAWYCLYAHTCIQSRELLKHLNS